MTFSLDELGEFGLAHARSVLIGKKGAQLLPTFHIQFIDRPPVIMATPWRTNREKATVIAAIRALIKELRPRVDSYAFISEAWLAVQRLAPRPTDLAPSEREDRKEVVIITAFDRKTGFLRAYEIKRGPDAAVTELIPEREPAEHFSGRLMNLFDDDD